MRLRLPAALAVAFALASAGQAWAARDVAQVYVTRASADSMVRLHDRRFNSGSNTSGLQIHVRPRVRRQAITGVGAAFTDSSLWLLSRLPSPQRQRVLRKLFGSGHGRLGLSVMRLPMGASDFTASGMYSYDDVPKGERDPGLVHFSIEHDRAYVLPVLREALHINPRLKLVATPWSPPGWMKTNESMVAGSPSGEAASLRSSAYGPFARYFVKFLRAYRAAGVPIWAITPQNEPDHLTTDYPGLILSADEQVRFLVQHLDPALRRAGIKVRLYGHDTNWYSSTLFGLLRSTRVRNMLSGVAFHCYLGDAALMADVHRKYPRLDVIEDECSAPQLSAIDVAVRSLDHEASVALTWNLALDPEGGPKVGTGCLSCTALITVDPEHRTVRYGHDLWELAHISAFVSRGARRIAAWARHHASSCGQSRACDVEWAAFRNPGGRIAFVAANFSTKPRPITLRRQDRKALRYVVPAATASEPAVVTVAW